MTTGSELASGERNDVAESLVTLAKYLELSLDAGSASS
jgi:hypothetical protein